MGSKDAQGRPLVVIVDNSVWTPTSPSRVEVRCRGCSGLYRPFDWQSVAQMPSPRSSQGLVSHLAQGH